MPFTRYPVSFDFSYFSSILILSISLGCHCMNLNFKVDLREFRLIQNRLCHWFDHCYHANQIVHGTTSMRRVRFRGRSNVLSTSGYGFKVGLRFHLDWSPSSTTSLFSCNYLSLFECVSFAPLIWYFYALCFFRERNQLTNEIFDFEWGEPNIRSSMSSLPDSTRSVAVQLIYLFICKHEKHSNQIAGFFFGDGEGYCWL